MSSSSIRSPNAVANGAQTIVKIKTLAGIVKPPGKCVQLLVIPIILNREGARVFGETRTLQETLQGILIEELAVQMPRER